MSDDLIKRLRYENYCETECPTQEAADRIEQLERENARLGAGWRDANFRALDAGLQLAKAVEALREMVESSAPYRERAKASAVLAELEGK